MANSSLDLKDQVPDGLVCIGYVSGFWGVQGEAKVFLYNVHTTLYGKWLDVELWDGRKVREPHQIKLHKGTAKRVTATIRGFDKKEDLLPILDRKILVREEALPSLGVDEYYHNQLLGMAVVDSDGKSYGVVREIVTGTVDIIVASDAGKTVYIPFIAQEVLGVDARLGLTIAPRDNDED